MIRVTALQAFRSPSFALLWSSQVISGFGDRITIFALAFVTWELTHSALSTALAVVFASVPLAVLGFFGGVIADAVGHRRAMILCDLIRMLAIGLVPFILVAGGSLAIVYVLVLIAGLCSAVFNPARLAIVPDLVPPDRLSASNAMVYASDRTVEIVGTLLAGLVVALLRESAFYLDAVTFGLSALLLLKIPLDEPPVRSVSWHDLFGQALDGLRVIRDSAILRANTVFSLLAQLSLPVVNGLTPTLIFREYALGPEHFGATEAAIAAGAVGGGLLYPSVFARWPKGRVIVLGFLMVGLLLLGLAASPGFAPSLGLFILLGVANVVYVVPNVTLSQEITPPALRARVFGARIALLNLTWLPVILMTGMLADFVSVQALFAAAGVFTLVVSVVGASFRIVRDAA